MVLANSAPNRLKLYNYHTFARSIEIVLTFGLGLHFSCVRSFAIQREQQPQP